MNLAFVPRAYAGPIGGVLPPGHRIPRDCPPPAIAPVPHDPSRPFSWRRAVLTAGVAVGVSLLSACAAVDGGPIAGEPTNGCLLAAINERAVLRAKNYLQPNVEAHLLAIWFEDSRHVALVVKGDHNWFAWDDAYGGRPLFLDGRTRQRLPDAISAAHAAFPHQNVQLAWWAD